MVNRPSVPEIITVNSETLQAQIRDLLPSQNGFGSELQASNIITPIIDLTAAAEGSTVRADLQSALAFGSQTAFDVTNTSTVIQNAPGFYRIIGSVYSTSAAASTNRTGFTMTDGLSVKNVYMFRLDGGVSGPVTESFDFIVFLAAGESITAVSPATTTSCVGSIRQIATGDGTLVNPNGFPL